MPVDTTRIEQIRAQITVERGAISQVRVKDPHLQKLLGIASHYLDDVEGYLNPVEWPDIQQVQTEKWWLTSMKAHMTCAREFREHVETVIAKFGLTSSRSGR